MAPRALETALKEMASRDLAGSPVSTDENPKYPLDGVDYFIQSLRL